MSIVFRQILIVSVKKLYSMKPFFSIIIATYNSELTLQRTLDSIITSDFKDYEIIIVDGLSTDSTLEIIRKNNIFIATVISEYDTGIYDAWNKGVLISKGEWIMFVGSDDLLTENSLQNYYEFVNASKNKLDYVSSRVQLIDEKQNVLRTIGRPWEWKKFRKYMCVAHVGSIHHNGLYKKYGLYDTDYKIIGDYEFLLRAGANLKTGYIEKITAQMQIGGISNINKNVFFETLKAKITTNSRGILLAKYDELIAKIIFYTRNVLLNKK